MSSLLAAARGGGTGKGGGGGGGEVAATATASPTAPKPREHIRADSLHFCAGSVQRAEALVIQELVSVH